MCSDWGFPDLETQHMNEPRYWNELTGFLRVKQCDSGCVSLL